VLVSEPDEYKSIAIDIGRVSRTEAEVLHGLKPGDEVVTHSQFLLDSESSITSDFKRMNLEPMEAGNPELPADEMDNSNMDMNPTDETDNKMGVDHD
jgi:Cu(I)/Ag(I) efflux system membrane fusion protein